MEDGISFGDSSSVAPPTKASAEGEVEPEVLLTSADSNSITDDTGNKSVRQTVEHSTSGDFDQSSEVIYSSSTTEIPTESSTPFSDLSTEGGEVVDLIASSTPKNLVVVRHGGKTESFHISGTDGLQRVEELDVVLSSTTESSSEDSAEVVTQSSEQSLIVSTDNIGGKSSEEMVSLESSSSTSFPETFDESATVALAMDKKFDQTSSLNDSSTENLSNNSIEVSTPDDIQLESSSELMAVSEKAYDTVYYGEEKSTASPSSEESFETVYFGPTEDITDSSSTTEGPDNAFSSTDGSFSTTEQSSVSVSETESSSTSKSASTESPETSSSRFSFEEEEVTLAENPEYPYIPDDLSIHNKELNEEEEKRRIPSKVLDEPISSTAGPCDECDIAKSGEVSTTQGASVEDMKISHQMDVIESRAPGEPHLIPEWERSTTLGPDATTAANHINKTVTLLEPVIKVNKSAALTVETIANDVDSDEKFGRKEPTTERPTTKGYADDIEEGSASSAQSEFESSTVEGASPKDDAESIKNYSGVSNSNENESHAFEGRSIPNAFENYWRYLRQVNAWAA